jgi:hypothetical protein
LRLASITLFDTTTHDTTEQNTIKITEGHDDDNNTTQITTVSIEAERDSTAVMRVLHL